MFTICSSFFFAETHHEPFGYMTLLFVIAYIKKYYIEHAITKDNTWWRRSLYKVVNSYKVSLFVFLTISVVLIVVMMHSLDFGIRCFMYQIQIRY